MPFRGVDPILSIALVGQTARPRNRYEPYKAKEKKDGNVVGTATNESKANGVMVWNFVVMNDSIAGTASFDTRVQNPAKYDFTGKELK